MWLNSYLSSYISSAFSDLASTVFCLKLSLTWFHFVKNSYSVGLVYVSLDVSIVWHTYYMQWLPRRWIKQPFYRTLCISESIWWWPLASKFLGSVDVRSTASLSLSFDVSFQGSLILSFKTFAYLLWEGLHSGLSPAWLSFLLLLFVFQTEEKTGCFQDQPGLDSTISTNPNHTAP